MPEITAFDIEPAGTFDSDALYEIVGSEVVETPPMGAYEAEIASLLQQMIGPFATEHRLGRVLTETLFDLRPAVDRSRRPDVAFVSAARWPLDRRAPRRAAAWPVVPDLAIEIISPSNTMDGVLSKVEEYFAAGSRLVWVMLCERNMVYVYQSPTRVRVLTLGGALDGGDVLPAFRLELSDLFSPPET